MARITVDGAGGESWQEPEERRPKSLHRARRQCTRESLQSPFLRINAVGGRTCQGPGRWQSSFFRSRPPRDISLEILSCALTWASLSAREGSLGTGPSLKSPHRGTSTTFCVLLHCKRFWLLWGSKAEQDKGQFLRLPARGNSSFLKLLN